MEAALAAMPVHGIVVLRRSRWYRSAPVPPSDQPWYINGIAEVRTRREPVSLLSRLQTIEAAMGRKRSAPNAARTCDLDLIDYGGTVADCPGGAGPALRLPHRSMRERLFVLLPLAELAPDWVHPATGEPIAALIAAVPPGQVCEPLAAAPHEVGRPGE